MLGRHSTYLRLACDLFENYNKSHARRKFVEALPTDKELVSTSMAAKGVNLINKMYAIERSFDGLMLNTL